MIDECLVVEFRTTGDDCPLADASRALDASIDAVPPLSRRDGNALLRFSCNNGGVGTHLDGDDRIRYLHRASTDDRYTYRCLSKAPCVVHELIDVGFLVDSVRYENGDERYVGAVVGEEVLRGVLSEAGKTVGVALERISPLGETGQSPVESQWNLTPKQAEALTVAYRNDYFDVPRGGTADDMAAELGISKTAFLERLRRGQSALLRQVLD